MSLINSTLSSCILLCCLASSSEASQLEDLACKFAIKGVNQASYFLAIKEVNPTSNVAKFWLTISAIQGNADAVHELQELDLEEDLIKKAFLCSLDYRKCFQSALDTQNKNELRFFEEYLGDKPLGWPNFETAATAYLKHKNSPCNLDYLDFSKVAREPNFN
ncbi:MAG: hypothetical protein ACJ0BI_01400 [Paracoccaceae bacterium]